MSTRRDSPGRHIPRGSRRAGGLARREGSRSLSAGLNALALVAQVAASSMMQSSTIILTWWPSLERCAGDFPALCELLSSTALRDRFCADNVDDAVPSQIRQQIASAHGGDVTDASLAKVQLKADELIDRCNTLMCCDCRPFDLLHLPIPGHPAASPQPRKIFWQMVAGFRTFMHKAYGEKVRTKYNTGRAASFSRCDARL